MIAHIALGGALGGLARFALGAWVTGWTGTGFPLATLGVNVGGAFLLGALAGLLPRTDLSPERRALLTVGFCGGFTTFSTFSWEALELMQRAAWSPALAYIALTAVAGPLAYLAGERALLRPPLRRS